jgi:hypothetical protein
MGEDDDPLRAVRRPEQSLQSFRFDPDLLDVIWNSSCHRQTPNG